MTGEHIFELKSGFVSLGSSHALKGVDLAMSPGEFLALLGSNGAGKTTLVRVLVGLQPLNSGEVLVFGRPLDRFDGWSRIGYVPQRVAVTSGTPASVMEVVLTGRIGRSSRFRPYKGADRVAAHEALQMVGMDHLADRPIAQLSGGQQQRVLIARALAGGPEILVLDEPLSGVDVDHQEKLAETLAAYSSGGGSVLMVAHSLGAMEELISREVVMDAGEVVYDGPHLPEHVHSEHVHHPEPRIEAPPLHRDTAAG